MTEAKLIARILLALILYRCLTYSLCVTTNNNSSPIKTVVVVVMENQSFDHMLGWTKPLNPRINGVTGRESNPLSTTNASSPFLLFTQGSTLVDPDSGHSYQAIFRQVFRHNNYNATAPNQACSMDYANMPHAVMSGFHPNHIPAYR